MGQEQLDGNLHIYTSSLFIPSLPIDTTHHPYLPHTSTATRKPNRLFRTSVNRPQLHLHHSICELKVLQLVTWET